MASLSTEQWLALQQEIAAVVRAGVPLDWGLRSLAADLPGQMGRAIENLAERIKKGEPLPLALAAVGGKERVYAAALVAGLRSGNPALALESAVRTGRRYQRMRSSLWAELIYPLVLLLVGCGLLGFSSDKLVPVTALSSESFDATLPWLQNFNTRFGLAFRTRPWVPLAVGAFIVAVIFFVGRATSLRADAAGTWHVFARIRACHALATYCDFLALLLQNSVPRPEALALAGEASGWGRLARDSAAVSEQLRRGERPQLKQPFPGAVALLVSSTSDGGTSAGDYVQLLQQEADRYRRQAERLSSWAETWFPLMLTLVIGVTCVVLLTLLNLGPFWNLLYRLSRPDNG
jgi:general secretion pathway protein F